MDLEELENFEWPYPWTPIEDEQECLRFARINYEVIGGKEIAPTIVEELKDEIRAKTHPLFNVECHSVAYNTRNPNEFILLTAKASMRVTWVHLTWSLEKRPEWPSVRGYKNLDEWAEEVRRFNESRPLVEQIEQVEQNSLIHTHPPIASDRKSQVLLEQPAKSVKDAIFTGAHIINRSGEEQSTGLGILVKQTRAVCNSLRLEECVRRVTPHEIAQRAQEEIAKLATQFIASFEITPKLTPEEQEEIVKQVQEEITRQAREEILELALEEAPEGAEGNDISSDQLAIALAEELAVDYRSNYDFQVLKINTIVAQLDKASRYIIDEDIVLKTKLKPDLWWASFDPRAIARVVLNLVVNAYEAMPEGGHLIIETSNVTALKNQQVQPGEYVLLAIRDTGHGMSDEVKSQIFEPYFTTKKEGEHRGLGLASVSGIVKQFGGHIQVQSEEGVGTTLKIYLPRVAAPEPQPNPLEANIGVRNLVQRVLADFGRKL